LGGCGSEMLQIGFGGRKVGARGGQFHCGGVRTRDTEAYIYTHIDIWTCLHKHIPIYTCIYLGKHTSKIGTDKQVQTRDA
jgi:hypothetical protein